MSNIYCFEVTFSDDSKNEGSTETQDTREQLEADVRKVLQSAYMYAWMHGNENRRGCSFEKLHSEFYNLLDRQAEITKRECDKPNWDYCETCEQSQQVDKLKRENIQLAHDLGTCMAEREQLREVLGKMLDIAHELQRVGALYGVD